MQIVKHVANTFGTLDACVGIRRWVFVAVAALAADGLPHLAVAGELLVNDLGIVQLAQAGVQGQSGELSAVIPPPPGPAPNRFAIADQYKLKGWTVPIPNAADTVDQGLFGIRNSLADAGISYLGLSSTSFADNIIHHGHPPGNSRDLQQYLGQLPTYTSQTSIYALADLSRYGVPDGQITIGGILTTTNWAPGGPDKVGIAALSYYQTFLNRTFELKLGYLANTLEFLGTQVGGSLAGGVFGPSAALFVEQGESSQSFPTPGVNIKINLPQNYYTKLGVQRAISPDGTITETNQNRAGVRFKVANSGVYVIDEVGYRVGATPGNLQTWIRGAATVSSSRYIQQGSATGQRTPDSYGLFLLADQQLLQLRPNAGPGSASQGLYVGFSAEYAPPYANRFSQYYEARLYGFGLIPSRPFDLASVVFTENVFSGNAIHLAQSRGQVTHNDTQSVTGSYSAHVFPGLNLNLAVTYTDNPTSVTYNTHTGSSLNVLTGLFAFF